MSTDISGSTPPPLGVGDFKKFYKTPKGQFLAREIMGALSVLWDDKATKDCDLLLVGAPWEGFFDKFKKARSVSIFLSATITPEKILKDGKTIVAVGDEGRLPFYPGSFNAALVFHGLENIDDPKSFLENLWKVLSPEGRVLLMVPNRLGAWKTSGVPGKKTSNPYTQAEAKKLLTQAGFRVLGSFGLCYGLPVGFLRTFFFSKILRTLSGGTVAGFPGFIILEADKDTGPRRVKFKDPQTRKSRVQVPGFIPE